MYIPRPIAIPLLILLALGAIAMFIHNAPDIWKYLREEGM